ncbi:serine/threonine-protein kinase 11-interacting protein isoform X3 [Ixodes scapularis]|uniref:serine/threonine-protein kinase 11-interacting protein isoform X3 n=1 Tax=Ixodes scapularis TaxID=6945 RepID=UPI001A9D6AB9|nr:serine/threonine-protein kinase 11-interacting protein isoform X3 [Ixodes scapularis]
MSTSSTRSDRIHGLAVFLREHGDVVLNGTRRLALTTSCLNELNYLFRQLLDGQENESFDVPAGYGGNSDFMLDVLFLHDFMQKTGSLKVHPDTGEVQPAHTSIVQSSQTIQGSLDLSKFHGLKILELKRVPPHLLVGLGYLIAQLETLICQRNISSLKEILRSRNKVPQPWLNIKIANFSYNTITSLDDSLSLLPKLQCLDCSNNSISGATGVQCLHNIKILNLSFNFLEHVNIFHERARESLTVLYLRNNCIESTRGLEGLRQLKELDLAYNCLADGDSLAAFKQLPNLEMLRLEGNPISFHKSYTAIVVGQLNWRAQTVSFRLDDKTLPKKLVEPKALRLQLARKSNMPAPEPVVSVPTLQPILPSELVVPQRQATEQHALPAVSVQGASPSKAVEAPPPGPADQEGSSCSSLETSDSLTPQRPGRRPRRRRSTRVAAILDQEHRSPVEAPATATVQQEILDYKSELESRKQQLGDEWLVGVSRLRLPDAQSTPCGTPESGTFVGPGFSAWQQEGDAITGVANRPSEGVASSRQGTGAAQGSSKGSAPQRRISELSEGVVVLDDVPPDHFGDPGGTGQPEGFSWTSMATSAFAADKADAEDDLGTKLFLAQRTGDGSETSVFVGIRDDVMKESDSLTGKILVCLDLNKLSSAALSDDKVVRLKFDTDIRNKKERCYIFDCSEDAEEVMKMLQPFAEAKALKDLYIEALQCVKCGARFPEHAVKKVVVKKKQHGVMTDVHESDRCPRCGGDILLAVDGPDDKSLMSSSVRTNTDLESAQSCFEESAYESATSEGMVEAVCQDNISEESIETVMPEQQGGLFRPGFRKSASDITVLSNPSQSSIMVISTSSANYTAMDVPQEGEKTLSPPPTVVLPTLKEIVEEPTVGISRTKSMNIGQRNGAADTSDTFLSEASFKSAMSHASVSRGSEARSNSPREMASLWELFEEREQISPESFSCIDHRVRLFLEVSVFTQEETFVCFLEVDLVTSSILEETAVLFVVSNKKAYFFKKTSNNREDPKAWLQLLESRPLDGLKLISLLLGNQGFRLSWLAEKAGVPWHTCLVRDADRCNCFLEYFTGVLQQRVPNPPLVEMDVSESLAQLEREVVSRPEGRRSPPGAGEDEVVLYVLGFWDRDAAGSVHPESVALVVTRCDIHVSRVHYLKSPKGAIKCGMVRYEPLIDQKISNLTAVHLHEDARRARLTFLDEDRGTESAWTVATETKASLHSLLNSLRTPWEELFGIEMPLALLAR